MAEISRFEEGVGLPAVEEAKKKARESKVKESVPNAVYYTVKSGKVLQVTFKPNGVYSSYFARVKNLGQEVYKLKVSEWTKQGKWIPEHKWEDESHDILKKIQKEAQRGK